MIQKTDHDPRNHIGRQVHQAMLKRTGALAAIDYAALLSWHPELPSVVIDDDLERIQAAHRRRAVHLRERIHVVEASRPE